MTPTHISARTFSTREAAQAWLTEMEREGHDACVLLATQDGAFIVTVGTTDCIDDNAGIPVILAGSFAFALVTILLPLAGWVVTS